MSMVAAGAAALTVVSIVADRRRLRRRDIEAVGWVPWTLLSVLGSIATLFAAALAITLKG
jgi:hypothetical protein